MSLVVCGTDLSSKGHNTKVRGISGIKENGAKIMNYKRKVQSSGTTKGRAKEGICGYYREGKRCFPGKHRYIREMWPRKVGRG